MTELHDTTPELSIVIPVFNEAGILRESVTELCLATRALQFSFEILLAENGSRDDTAGLGAQLAEEFPEVRVFSFPSPNYGGALREGIIRARGRWIICEEIDLCDVEFHRRALALLRAGEAQFVIGSKAMPGAHDTRPIGRRVATRVYNRLLRTMVGFRGTDTHGLKAFDATVGVAVARACVVEHDVFASEFVVRAHRVGLQVVEVPVQVHEKRAPSIHLLRRVPRVLRNLVRLTVAVHSSSTGSAPEMATRGDPADG